MSYPQLLQRTGVALTRFVRDGWIGVLAMAFTKGPRILRRSLAAIGSKLDTFFAGVWWWHARRYRAEKRLGHALERFGDRSIAARWATERYRELHFAATYWRSAPALVRRVALAAREAGVSVTDLRLIVLNTDLCMRRNEVFLRRSTLMRPLSAAFATIVCVHWVLMDCLVVLAPGAAWLKVLAIIGIFVIYATLYRGWSLFGYRALAAVDRSGNLLEQVCVQTQNAHAADPQPTALKHR
ncbi:hypothetical protein MUU75_13460 [Pseudoxanthomonas mexicana]|uniref:hypothetical protein n=1 Tax=Pseudoxanthomonas mexicana TaxID=128785 RepID=UPI001FD6D561|nr:hypothetical protein [Pseudoxanthomonas mexicana]UOV04140.1 hypothetical protein MUU75_13460 [Pseudoxanthomonas mexicana]